MKLKTKIKVSRIEEGKIAIIDKIVIGELTANKVFGTDGIEVGFIYSDEDGKDLEFGAPTFTWDAVNTLYDAIKGGAPKTTFKALIDYCFDMSFKIEMANTFGITVNDIEEI